LREAAGLLTDRGRDRVMVLVTDGHVGNEDQILAGLTSPLNGVRVHTVGIDRAVNAGFLGRLAELGQGRFELVESENRLDQAMENIHHRIGAPMVTGLRLTTDGDLRVVADSVAPSRLGAIYPGVPLTIRGRWDGTGDGSLTVHGTAADDSPWRHRVLPTHAAGTAATSIWARAHLRDLEDRYTAGDRDERRIVATSLRYGVLCRFTAFVAVDSRVVAEGTAPHRIVQPVERPSGWAGGAAMASPAEIALQAAERGGPPPPRSAAAQAPMAASRRPSARRAKARSLNHPGVALPYDDELDVPDFLKGPGADTSPSAPANVRREDRLRDAHHLVASEVEWLGKPPSSLEAEERWTLLTELRTRLDELLTHLRAAGVPEPELSGLADALAGLPLGSRPDDLAAVWDRTLEALRRFTGEERSRPFWKRPAIPGE
jgi:Ca-activated chloride channel family protein